MNKFDFQFSLYWFHQGQTEWGVVEAKCQAKIQI